MSDREKLNTNDSMLVLIEKLSEGNPGGLTVLTQILKKDPLDGIMRFLDLDDMNMRGPQIWVGYKDHCGQDIDKFITAVKNRDPDMIQTVNKQCGDRHTAVISGASFKS